MILSINYLLDVLEKEEIEPPLFQEGSDVI